MCDRDNGGVYSIHFRKRSRGVNIIGDFGLSIWDEECLLGEAAVGNIGQWAQA